MTEIASEDFIVKKLKPKPSQKRVSFCGFNYVDFFNSPIVLLSAYCNLIGLTVGQRLFVRNLDLLLLWINE